MCESVRAGSITKTKQNATKAHFVIWGNKLGSRTAYKIEGVALMWSTETEWRVSLCLQYTAPAGKCINSLYHPQCFWSSQPPVTLVLYPVEVKRKGLSSWRLPVQNVRGQHLFWEVSLSEVLLLSPFTYRWLHMQEKKTHLLGKQLVLQELLPWPFPGVLGTR